jgi:hypothetical protein
MRSLYGSCIIKFAGGEPFTYPGFMDLLAHLGRDHFLDLSSNLYWDVSAFLASVPAGMARIEPSYHPRFCPDKAEFAAKCRALAGGGFMGSVHMVGYPPFLREVVEAKAFFESEGLNAVILPFRGSYQGRDYPGGYNDEEKRLMQTAVEQSRDSHIHDVNKRYLDWYVEGGDKLEAKPVRRCRMGYSYAKIQPDGQVVRCCSKTREGACEGFSLGSILDPGFRLHDEPRPCGLAPCACWKPMIEGEQDAWLPLWRFETYSFPP